MGTTNKIYWTYAMLLKRIQDDLDIDFTEEDFVSSNEVLGYCNEAIDTAEQLVMSMYEDYFLSRATLNTIVDKEDYPLPPTIYAHKIRRLVAKNNDYDVYTVKRIRDWHKFEEYAFDNLHNTSTRYYRYLLVNTTPGDPSIVLTPTPTDDTTSITVWFTRQANRIELDTDILDIPEANKYILAYVKNMIYTKEQNPLMARAAQDVLSERELLETTLSTMIPDADNEIEINTEFYEDHN